MKRWVALFAGAIAIFVVAARPAAAVPDAPATQSPTSVPADAVTVTPAQVQGSGLAVTLDAGAAQEYDVVVANQTANLRLTVKLSATDATGKIGTGDASWLAFGDDEIELDPHVATTVPMTVAVPHDTQPGSDLTHVVATVESAVAAADGTPVDGTATSTFPVSIAVSGTPTAQLAIADVHRVDNGSQHQLAVVLRNYGDSGAHVGGHIVVAGDQPQTLSFNADLGPSRDTTVDVDWRPPGANSPTDIAVDLEYGGGNVASWSSRLGGAPTNLTPTSDTTPTPTTVPASNASPDTTTGATASKPWWKQTWVEVLAILGLLAAAAWFVFEMRGSRRRRDALPFLPYRFGTTEGWMPAATHTNTMIGEHGIRVEVFVQLVQAEHDESSGRADSRREESRREKPRRADSRREESRREKSRRADSRRDADVLDELRAARAGPAPPDRGPPLMRDPPEAAAHAPPPSAPGVSDGRCRSAPGNHGGPETRTRARPSRR